ncbi:MAG: hypothetical protein ACTSQ1_03425 [Promethearchaeota archaeon]
MVDEIIETKDGLKLRKLVELKTSTAAEYQDAMLDRVEYFKKQNEKKSIFNSSIQNTVVSTLSTVLDLKLQLEKSLGVFLSYFIIFL